MIEGFDLVTKLFHLGERTKLDMNRPVPQMRQQTPQIYQRYQKLIALLKFMNLVVYGLRDIDKIVQEHLVSAIQAGINVKEKFQRVLDDFDDVLMAGQIA